MNIIIVGCGMVGRSLAAELNEEESNITVVDIDPVKVREVSEKYDEDYFKEKTLFLVYVGASSGSFRYGVNSVYNDGKNFYIHIETTNNPEVCTADMSGWFVTVGVDKNAVKNCTTFDADLDNVVKVTSSEYLQLYDVTSTEEIQAKYDNEEFI